MKFLLALFFLFGSEAFACPYCAGSDTNPTTLNTLIILGVFILLTYVPMAMLFRMIRKHRNINKNLTK